MRRLVMLLVGAFAVAAGTAHATARTTLTVYAASSLTDVFPAIDPAPHYSFAGSDTLAAQIRAGAPADVFASANTALPRQLHAAGLLTKPVVFTRNALVLVVPRKNPAHIHSPRDLARPGVTLVVAGPTVPVGAYTARVLARLGLSRVLKHVVSREVDVRTVLTKVALGEADAGFVYATDAKTVAGRVLTLRLPARAQPNVEYAVGIVVPSAHRAQAQAWIARLLASRAQARLRAAGFLSRVQK